MSSKPPLGLPEGSVRAIIALAIVLTACALSALGRPIPELLGQAFLLAISIYGLTRSQAGDRVTVPEDPAPSP